MAEPIQVTITKTIFTVAPTPTPTLWTQTYGTPWTTATPWMHTYRDQVVESYPPQPSSHWEECKWEIDQARSLAHRWSLWPLIFVAGILAGLAIAVFLWGLHRIYKRHAHRVKGLFKGNGRIRLEDSEGMTEGSGTHEHVLRPAQQAPSPAGGVNNFTPSVTVEGA